MEHTSKKKHITIWLQAMAIDIWIIVFIRVYGVDCIFPCTTKGVEILAFKLKGLPIKEFIDFANLF